RGALQAASANPALVRARGAAEAVALARKYAALHGCGFGTVGSDPDAGARHGREPGRNRNYFEYAREDDRDGKTDGRVRTSRTAGVVGHGKTDGCARTSSRAGGEERGRERPARECTAQQLMLYYLCELAHLFFHLDHLLAHKSYSRSCRAWRRATRERGPRGMRLCG